MKIEIVNIQNQFDDFETKTEHLFQVDVCKKGTRQPTKRLYAIYDKNILYVSGNLDLNKKQTNELENQMKEFTKRDNILYADIEGKKHDIYIYPMDHMAFMLEVFK